MGCWELSLVGEGGSSRECILLRVLRPRPCPVFCDHEMSNFSLPHSSAMMLYSLELKKQWNQVTTSGTMSQNISSCFSLIPVSVTKTNTNTVPRCPLTTLWSAFTLVNVCPNITFVHKHWAVVHLVVFCITCAHSRYTQSRCSVKTCGSMGWMWWRLKNLLPSTSTAHRSSSVPWRKGGSASQAE